MFRFAFTSLFVVTLLAGGAAAQQQQCPPPAFTILQNGQTANACAVMGNFQYLQSTLAPQVNPSFVGQLNLNTNGNIANSTAEITNSLAVIANGQAGESTNGAVAWNYYNNGNSPTWSGALLNYMGTNVTGNFYGVLAANQGSLLFQNVQNGIIASNGANITIAPYANPSATFMWNGNVGIGTTNPWATLTVQSSSGTQVLSGTGGATDGLLGFYYNGTPEWQIFAYHSNGDFYVQNASGSSTIGVVSGQNAWSYLSDVRLKQNIETLPVLDRLNGYRAVSFNWRQTGAHDVGVVAQELYNIFPEVVNKGNEGQLSGPTDPGTWSVQYDKLGALALEVAKELKTEQDKLNAENNKLHAENNKLRAENDTEVRDIKVLIMAVKQQQAQIVELQTKVADLRAPQIIARILP